MMEISVAKPNLELRRRDSRFPPVVIAQRREPPYRLVVAVALPLVALAILAVVARRRFFRGVAVLAEAVEEVADAVEDAAEDLADAARERAEDAD
jgi:hypothetical protein